MDNPIYLGFSVLELSKLLRYETYYDKLQPSFGKGNSELPYTDCDSFVLSTKTKNITNHLKNLEVFFDFSNLNENHELHKFKNETPENIWIDEFDCLRFKIIRRKAYSFKCGD